MVEKLIVKPERLHEVIKTIFLRNGLSDADAGTVADNLVDANIRGVHSHGVLRTVNYVDRIKAGGTNPHPDIRIVSETPSSAVIDGDNGMGSVVSMYAVELCRKKAAESGVAVVTVKNSNHYGTAAFYCERLAGDDMIAFSASNVEPNMTLPGALKVTIGNNPFCMVAPAGKHINFCSDMASSQIAWGKVLNYRLNKEKLPGVYAIDESMTSPGQAISRAVMACNYAKNVANKPYVFVNKAMSTRIYRQKQIEDRYEEALANNEFRIYLQPKVDTETMRIVGAESLARWFCNGIVLYPTEFVPILEQEGMVASLDLYVLKKTCEYIREWLDSGITPVKVSVNFSRRDLSYKNLAKEITSIIDSYNIDRKYIEIEVTETASEDERIMMTSFLSKLKDEKISTAIDDFGTGYSSLSTLRDFPVSVIKIDRSFINNEELNTSDEIVLKNIINMARELGIDVVTEGVERPDQTQLLKSVGCHVVQGFLYDNPMPKKDFEKRLIKGTYED